MRNDFLIETIIGTFKRFNAIAVPMGLMISLVVCKDLVQFMLPIAVLYYILIGIILWDRKVREKETYVNPDRVFMMDIIYISLMVCICYGWLIMIFYMEGMRI